MRLPRTIRDGFVTTGIWLGIYAAIVAFTFIQTVLDCGTDRACEAGYGLLGSLFAAAILCLVWLVARIVRGTHAQGSGLESSDVEGSAAGADHSE